MEKEKFLEILKRIQLFLENDDLFEAKEYIKLEIENIEGITEKNCKNTYYSSYDYYCKKCSNFNCNDNCNKNRLEVINK